MPIQRDADGNIIDTPSEATRDTVNVSPTDFTRFESHRDTVNVSPTLPPKGGDSPFEAKTQLAGGEQIKKNVDQQTRVFRPGKEAAPATAQPADTQPATAQTSAMDDPPVGWLVVIAGPGQGNFVTLGNGSNSLGRDTTERLPLNFGDEMISRSGHATFTYDPKGKQFYIQHGGGTNLTYVDGQPVLAPQELPSGTNIVIGNTTLRFIPLCGAQFDWDGGQ